jgi:hypothetical protein
MKKARIVFLMLFVSMGAISQEPPPQPDLTGNQLDLLTQGDIDNRQLLLAIIAKSISSDQRLSKYICTPEGVTYLQAGKVVDKYMFDHPEYLHEQMRAIAFAALFWAFPCPT